MVALRPEGRSTSARRAFAPRAALAVGVVVLLVVGDPDPALGIVLLGFTGVVAMVTDVRFDVERRLDDRSLPSREAWVPLLVLAGLLGFGFTTLDRAGEVVLEKLDVVGFILAFALVSDGLGRSGLVQLLARRVADRSGGSTARLVLSLFLLSSALTYLTSNDVVILTMTPIVLAVAHRCGLRNATLLLLSQFVAANTVSMGLLIGSPTNLILGRAAGLDFFEYFAAMLVPSAIALLSTFVVVSAIHDLAGWAARRPGTFAHRLVGDWAQDASYELSPPGPSVRLTAEMRRWSALFALAVAALALATTARWNLLWVAVPIAGASLALSSRRIDESSARRRHVIGRSLRSLPYGIVVFGLVFFVLADGLARTTVVEDRVVPFVSDAAEQDTPLVPWGAIAATGATVNVVNDLPASALAGEVVDRSGVTEPIDRLVLVQAVAVGLNIGTYVTPIGALAGLIWFDIVRRERRRYTEGADGEPVDLRVPDRRDLVLYGSVAFLATGAVIGAATHGLATVLRLGHQATGGPDAGSFGVVGGAVAALCASTLVLVPVAFWRVLRRHGLVGSGRGRGGEDVVRRRASGGPPRTR